jgi:hypothetical protein
MAANDCSAGSPTSNTTRAEGLAGPRRTTRHLAEAFGPPTGTADQFQCRADQVWRQAAGQQKLTWRLGVLAFHCQKKRLGMSGFVRRFRVIRLTPGDDDSVPVQRQDAKAPRCPNPLRSTIFLPSRASMPGLRFIPSSVRGFWSRLRLLCRGANPSRACHRDGSGARLPVPWRGKRSDRLDYFSANGTTEPA